VSKQCQYIPFRSKTACPICVSGGRGWGGERGAKFKQLHLPCALKESRAHITTRLSRHTRALVKLPPRHGAVVRVKRNVRICADMWFDIVENYSCKLLGYDAVQFGRLSYSSDIDVRYVAAGRRASLAETLCHRHQTEGKVTGHEVDLRLPTNAGLRMRGDILQSPYVFIF
jgi:hypothetical protein